MNWTREFSLHRECQGRGGRLYYENGVPWAEGPKS